MAPNPKLVGRAGYQLCLKMGWEMWVYSKLFGDWMKAEKAVIAHRRIFSDERMAVWSFSGGGYCIRFYEEHERLPRRSALRFPTKTEAERAFVLITLLRTRPDADYSPDREPAQLAGETRDEPGTAPQGNA
jgi:hypothetical protein